MSTFPINAKAECPTVFEQPEVKKELEHVPLIETACDRACDEDKFKIDIDNNVLSTNHSDEDCKDGIVRFSGQTYQPCLTCGTDDCKQHLPPPTEKRIKLETTEHESEALKSNLYEEISCKRETKEEDQDGNLAVEISTPSTSKQHQRDYSVDLRATDAEVYCCASCNYSTKCRNNFTQHQLLRHNRAVKLYKCEECAFTTRSRCYLYTHARVKHDPKAKVYGCSECQYTTRYKSKLSTHMIVRHDRGADSVYTCSSCKFTTKYKTALAEHVNAQHGGGVRKCSKCELIRRIKSNLLKHVGGKRDSASEVYKCSECKPQ